MFVSVSLPARLRVSFPFTSSPSILGTPQLARYPLLLILLAIIFGEFSFYVATRQVVNVLEFLLAWTGHKRVLRAKLRNAKTYEDWKEAAIEMDEFLGFDLWKTVDEDSHYDWSLVRKVRRSLASLRAAGDVRGVIGVLDVCLRPSFAGVEGVRLYSETFYGTKDLVEGYIDEVSLALQFVRESPEATLEEKKKFFKSANKNFGSSALCLSGGASFGYYHTGVVLAFLNAGLLPRVVTGTSAGALIAALITTRTDDELRELLVPELADRITACEEPLQIWLKRFWKTGARFDTILWARKATFFTHGSLTFREAYERTGRVLNVSVIPHDRHSPTKLLNYLTAPDCLIWTAIIASAAVPGILNPVVLMNKTKSGDIVPWNWGTRFKDGSLRVDIPLQSLHLLFNVNHSIVSQVNPHVHLFFFAPKGSAGRPVAHRKGKGWRGGFLLSAMEQYLKLELTKNFKVIRDLELMPTMLGQDWSSVFLQRFDGSVTIWPRTRVQDWFRLLTDPDRKELKRMLRVGEVATFPKLHMISNRDRIEREVLKGRQEVRAALSRERTSTDTPASQPNGPPDTSNQPPRPSLPIESDAELGFRRDSAKFISDKKAGLHGHHSGRKHGFTDAAVGLGSSGPSSGERERRSKVGGSGGRSTNGSGSGNGLRKRNGKQADSNSIPHPHHHPLHHTAESTDTSDQEHSQDQSSSNEAAAAAKAANANGRRSFSPIQSFSTLGSSFNRIRTQSFPTFQIPWTSSSPSTSPRIGGGSSLAGPSSASIRSSKSRSGRSMQRRKSGSSSSSEDEDELREWGRNKSRGGSTYSGGGRRSSSSEGGGGDRTAESEERFARGLGGGGTSQMIADLEEDGGDLSPIENEEEELGRNAEVGEKEAEGEERLGQDE
ncbi:acyl transferase/acyl hydrolase/lysophospholipase [Mrakia frigida]|uniref:patatin-like phospholipase domain-containing protein n=1 Tax=Mrakia frigida TaxID=29902 RepID=UPI003FCC0E23